MRTPSAAQRPSRRAIGRSTALVVLALWLAGCGATDLIPEPATPLPTTDEHPAAGWGWHVSARDRRDAVGQLFEFVCPADGGLSDIWGTDVYTDDSSICTAAVHVGLIRREAGGRVTILIRPGLDQYRGSIRNGIVSAPYGPWDGSFVFVS
jgi:LCCL domain